MTEAPLGLTCQDVVELVTDHIEDTLSARDRLRFVEHLELCEGCANYVEQMRATVSLLGNLKVEQVPDLVMQRLLLAFRSWREI